MRNHAIDQNIWTTVPARPAVRGMLLV